VVRPTHPRIEVDPKVLRSLFGGGNKQPQEPEAQQPSPAKSETESIRRIAGEIEALPVGERRYIAGYAYVLARAANADLEISKAELEYMEKAVIEVGGMSEAQAVLVVEMARNMAELYGATDDYVVTRAFAKDSTKEQRENLLRTAFAVGAADDTITAAESAALNQIGKELGFSASEVDDIRVEFADKLAALQAMRAARGA
jgi:tellurite resistance protein